MHTINLIDYAQFAVSMIGTSVNLWLLMLVISDYRWIRAKNINGRARLQQIGRLFQEVLRLVAQLALLSGAVATLSVKDEVIIAVNAAPLLRVVMWRSAIMMFVATILAAKSVGARIYREAIDNYEDDGKITIAGEPTLTP